MEENKNRYLFPTQPNSLPVVESPYNLLALLLCFRNIIIKSTS